MNLLLSLLSGFLVILSFPNGNFWFLGYFCLVPLLFAVQGLSFKKSFLIGWAGGTLAFCGVLYWVVPTFLAAGLSLFLGSLCLLLLAAYCGLYTGLFAGLIRFFSDRSILLLFAGAALWVGLEWIRGHFMTGFPWAILGYSQWKILPVIQISEWTGVYGVSALLVLCNLAICISIKQKRIASSAFGITFLFFALSGFLYFQSPKNTSNKILHVATLQGNIDQYKKWDQQFVYEIMGIYKTLARNAAASTPKPDLILWPETAVPGWIPQDKNLTEDLVRVAKESGTNHLISAITQDQSRNLNSIFYMDSNGTFVDRYDKMHLVPFGEFVPFQSMFGRWISVLNELGGFDGGGDKQNLTIRGAIIGTSVCYESIFPELMRLKARDGAEVLINVVNDGWYLDTAALPQHFAMNVFRAVENRRWLVRAANTGISGIIRPDGSIAEQTQIYQRTWMSGDVELMQSPKTFYTRFGDIFAFGCMAFVFAALFYKRSRK